MLWIKFNVDFHKKFRIKFHSQTSMHPITPSSYELQYNLKFKFFQIQNCLLSLINIYNWITDYYNGYMHVVDQNTPENGVFMKGKLVISPTTTYMVIEEQVNPAWEMWGGVTKPIFSVPPFFPYSVIVKTNVSYWISRLYLAGVAAAQLRWHLSNMNVIQGIWQVFFARSTILLTEKLRNGALVTPTRGWLCFTSPHLHSSGTATRQYILAWRSLFAE